MFDQACDDAQKFCLCGSSDESSFMICCDHCGIWYHGACLQVTRVQAKRIETYACPPCISKDPNLAIIYRAAKKEREKGLNQEQQHKVRRNRNDSSVESSSNRPVKEENGLLVETLLYYFTIPYQENELDRFIVRVEYAV
ncbi:unnamed protein product [Thelazia callipaeda]|uniref:PHD-type domain-containing protein n=1 Tax=Thelazia callipaeda TaxID=103827 RepID=A0A0N5CUR7_THECL|nr:unnamed protein product [Thelazia callipaeda]